MCWKPVWLLILFNFSQTKKKHPLFNHDLHEKLSVQLLFHINFFLYVFFFIYIWCFICNGYENTLYESSCCLPKVCVNSFYAKERKLKDLCNKNKSNKILPNKYYNYFNGAFISFKPNILTLKIITQRVWIKHRNIP